MALLAATRCGASSQRPGPGVMLEKTIGTSGSLARTFATNAWKSASSCAGRPAVVDVVSAYVQHDEPGLVRQDEPVHVAQQIRELERIDAAIDQRVARAGPRESSSSDRTASPRRTGSRPSAAGFPVTGFVFLDLLLKTILQSADLRLRSVGPGQQDSRHGEGR